MTQNKPHILDRIKGVTLYTWDNKFFQVDLDISSEESFCIGCFESLEAAQREFFKAIIDQINYFHHELPAKVQRLLSLASNSAAYLGEVRNCVIISLKILETEGVV